MSLFRRLLVLLRARSPLLVTHSARLITHRLVCTRRMVFNNTYVQQAVCGPSRNSFLTGKRPDSTNVWTFKTNFRASGMDTTGAPGASWTTFPGMFKQHGYNVLGMGKIFHPGSPPANDCVRPHPLRPGMQEDCRSWSTEFETPAPADIVALGDNPMQITDCQADSCNFTYFQPDAQIGNCDFTRPGEGGGFKHWTPTCCDLPVRTPPHCGSAVSSRARARALRMSRSADCGDWMTGRELHRSLARRCCRAHAARGQRRQQQALRALRWFSQASSVLGAFCVRANASQFQCEPISCRHLNVLFACIHRCSWPTD